MEPDSEVAEEQAMEMEALQAIFMDDIEGELFCFLGQRSHL